MLGVAGLMGAGRTEVAQTIFGYRKANSGEILIDGKPVSIKSPIDAMKHRIGFVTEDRKTQGLVLDFSIQENISLANLEKCSSSGIMNKQRESSMVHQYIEDLKIRTSGPEQSAKSLSGGNQQKVVIAKWLGTNPEILILDEPTRGVDIGAKKEIYHIINKLAESGVAIIVISSELPGSHRYFRSSDCHARRIVNWRSNKRTDDTRKHHAFCDRRRVTCRIKIKSGYLSLAHYSG